MPPSQEEILIRLINAEVKIEMLEETLRIILETLNPESEAMNEPKKDPQQVGHNLVNYPPEALPHSAMHLVNHFRGQDTLSLPEVGEHAATVLGCASSMAKGPEPVGQAQPDQPHGNPKTLSDEELANIIEDECGTANAAQSSVNPVGAFPAWLIPILIEAAIRVFNEWKTK